LNAEWVVKELVEIYSDDLERLTPARLEVLRIIDEFYRTENRWPRSKELERRYGSLAVYDVLSDLQKFEWIERVESKEKGGKVVIYKPTKIGKAIALLGRELREMRRKKVAEMLLEKIKSVDSILRERLKNLMLMNALINAAIELAQSNLDQEYARESIKKVNEEKLIEKTLSIFENAQANDNVRNILFSNILRMVFEPSCNQENGSMDGISNAFGRKRKKLEKELDKMLKVILESLGLRRRGLTGVMRVIFIKFVRAFNEWLKSCLHLAGIMHLITLGIAIALGLYAAFNPTAFYVFLAFLVFFIIPALPIIGCSLVLLKLRRR